MLMSQSPIDGGIDVVLGFPLFATYFVPSHPYPACVYQLKPLVAKVDDLIITVL